VADWQRIIQQTPGLTLGCMAAWSARVTRRAVLQGRWARTWFPISHHCYDAISTQGKHAPGEAGSLIQQIHSGCVSHDCKAMGTAKWKQQFRINALVDGALRFSPAAT
jgi:hypothetical protein